MRTWKQLVALLQGELFLIKCGWVSGIDTGAISD